MRIPRSPSAFRGRDAELARLDAALREVPVAVVYGVAGVGKSALAYAFAASWSGPVFYHRTAPQGVVEDAALELTRQVGRAPPAGRIDIEEALAAVGDRLDELGALLVIDDLDRLTSPAAFLGLVAESLVRARVVATSRERIGSPADGPERLEIHLGGLGDESARQVWDALDELYGETSGFERACERARGNPFMLRRAHAGGAAEVDPIAAAVSALSPVERRVAQLLALGEVRPSVELLESMVPGATAAVATLTRRLVVERDGEGACTLHDLFRSEILRALAHDERRELHDALAAAIASSDLPLIDRARDVCRHLAALDHYEQAGEYLLEHSADLVRAGGAWELLRSFDAIPPERRSLLVQIERVRTLGRVLDLDSAYRDLARLVDAGAGPRVPLELAFGQLAAMTCHLDTAHRSLQVVLEAPDASPRQRMLAETALATLRAHAGAFDEARQLVGDALARAEDPVHVGNLHLAEAFTYWVEGRGEESEPALLRALGHLAHAPPSFRKSFAAPLMLAGLEATRGRFAEADEALRTAAAVLRNEADQRPRFELSAVEALVAYHRGFRQDAVERWRPVRDAMDRSGYRLGVLWVDCLVGQATLELGWRSEALALLEDVVARARASGMGSMELMATRALESDPLVAVSEPTAATPMPSSPVRAIRWRSLAALRAARLGDDDEARRLLDANADAGQQGLDRALDRAMANLALAVIARRAGDESLAGEHERAALEDADAGGVDADLVPAISAALQGVTLVSVRPPPSAEPESPAITEAVVDRRRHEVRTGQGSVSFARRPVLRRLLYALADRPGEVVTRDDLVKELWSAVYHPLVHDNALLVNISRLRRTLAGVGILVVCEEDGYRIDLAQQHAAP